MNELMSRHQLLASLHEVLQPRTYLEVGVNTGRSLTLSRTRSIGVDPFFTVDTELQCDVHLVRATSDEFFAREHPLAHFDRPLVDLAFIDGMHLSEYALRDFMNIEAYCHAGSVLVFDDMLPRKQIEADRARRGSAEHGAWTGDVYKVTETLRTHRPDLLVIEVDTKPTGTVVVLLPDARNRALHRVYDQVVADYVVPDPQVVPEDVFGRTHAISGEQLVGSSVWSRVRELRARGGRGTREELRTAYREAGLLAAGGSTPSESVEVAR